MLRFASRLSTVLYVLLTAGLALTVICIGGAIIVIAGEALVPGIFSRFPFSPGSDLRMVAPAVIAVFTLALVTAIGTVLPLIGMLRSTAAGRPFVRANMHRLYVVAGTIAFMLLAKAVSPYVFPDPGDPGDPTILPLDGGAVFALLLTLVLAEVFREGVRLREDNEATI